MLVDPGEVVVLLPAATRYEQVGGGTSTTTERRVAFSPEVPGPRVGEARSEWQIFADIARYPGFRAEAEALKAEYEKKVRDAARDADALRAAAEDEAKLIVAKAQADATALIERRGKSAEEVSTTGMLKAYRDRQRGKLEVTEVV